MLKYSNHFEFYTMDIFFRSVLEGGKDQMFFFSQFMLFVEDPEKNALRCVSQSV